MLFTIFKNNQKYKYQMHSCRILYTLHKKLFSEKFIHSLSLCIKFSNFIQINYYLMKINFNNMFGNKTERNKLHLKKSELGKNTSASAAGKVLTLISDGCKFRNLLSIHNKIDWSCRRKSPRRKRYDYRWKALSKVM